MPKTIFNASIVGFLREQLNLRLKILVHTLNLVKKERYKSKVCGCILRERERENIEYYIKCTQL